MQALAAKRQATDAGLGKRPAPAKVPRGHCGAEVPTGKFPADRKTGRGEAGEDVSAAQGVR